MKKPFKTKVIYLCLFTLVFVVGSAYIATAQGNIVIIDQYNRVILNGEPFFPIGLYVAQCSTVDQTAQLDEIENSPFDTLMNYNINRCGQPADYTYATDGQIETYLDQLASRNLYLAFSLSEFFDGAPAGTATWTFTAAQDGNYNVYAWWNAAQNRATDAPYTVNYDGGSQTIRVNQQNDGAQWNLLGSFAFLASAPGSVMIENDADGYVIADAIRIEGAGPSGTDIIVDEEAAAYTGTWTCATEKPDSYNEDHCWHAKFFDDIAAIGHIVDTFKDHSAVVTWYLNDERDTSYVTQLEKRYAKIKELDVEHPVWSVHWNTAWLLPEAHTTDILGVDSYPIAHLPITEVSRVADAAAEVGSQTGQPFWLVPQIFSWTDAPWDPRADTGRPPTKAEMRAMSYLAVNHGTKGLIYYSYFNISDDTDYATRWPQIKDIASEIHQLRPVFLSTQQTNSNDVTCNNSDIDFKLMKNDDRYYLFAVNTKNGSVASVSFQINLELKPEVLSTLFEGGREEFVTDGKITDSFGAYEVHVYYWDEPEIEEETSEESADDTVVDRNGDGGGGGCFFTTSRSN